MFVVKYVEISLSIYSLSCNCRVDFQMDFPIFIQDEEAQFPLIPLHLTIPGERVT